MGEICLWKEQLRRKLKCFPLAGPELLGNRLRTGVSESPCPSFFFLMDVNLSFIGDKILEFFISLLLKLCTPWVDAT